MFRLIITFTIILGTINCYAINLEEAINKAFKNSSKIKSNFYQYKSTEKQLKSFGIAGFLPEINLQYKFNENFNFTSPTGKNLNLGTYFTLDQKLIDGGANFATFNKSQYLLKAEKTKLKKLKQEIALNAVKAYVNVLKKTEMLKLREHKGSVALEHLSAMQKSFSLSEVTNTEVSLAKAKFSSSVSERVDAEGKLKLAKIAYYHLIGEEADNLSEVDDLFLPTLPELNECLRLAKLHNLSLKEAMYQKKAARMEVVSEQSKWLPSLVLKAQHYSKENIEFKDLLGKVDVALILDIPILKRGINSFGIGKARMDVKKFTHAYHEAVKNVEQMVINAWNNVLTAQAVIKASQEAEKAATLALEGIEQEVSLNLKSTSDLLKAEDALFKARSDLVETKSNYVISVYDLLFIIDNIDV